MTGTEIAALAATFAGALDENQQVMLENLCRAAEAGLRLRLRPDAAGYAEALGCAAARLACRQLQQMQGMPTEFTAGDFSVKHRDEDAMAQALELLRPWLAPDFAFQKV